MLVKLKKKNFFDKRKYLKLICIHTPKCGGTFFSTIFRKYWKNASFNNLPGARGHKTYQQLKKVYEKNKINIHDSYIISLVRNPWDWHVSWFFYIKNDFKGASGHIIEHELFQKMNFKNYLEWLDDPYIKKTTNYQNMQMTDWFIDKEENIVADKVLRQESLYDDILNLIADKNLDLKKKKNILINKSDRLNYQNYYNDSDIIKIFDRHKRDIKFFNYKF